MRAWEVPAPAAHPAHHRDIKVRLLRRDEPKNDYRVSLSRAKKAAAFFALCRRPGYADVPVSVLVRAVACRDSSA